MDCDKIFSEQELGDYWLSNITGSEDILTDVAEFFISHSYCFETRCPRDIPNHLPFPDEDINTGKERLVDLYYNEVYVPFLNLFEQYYDMDPRAVPDFDCNVDFFLSDRICYDFDGTRKEISGLISHIHEFCDITLTYEFPYALSDFIEERKVAIIKFMAETYWIYPQRTFRSDVDKSRVYNAKLTYSYNIKVDPRCAENWDLQGFFTVQESGWYYSNRALREQDYNYSEFRDVNIQDLPDKIRHAFIDKVMRILH